MPLAPYLDPTLLNTIAILTFCCDFSGVASIGLRWLQPPAKYKIFLKSFFQLYNNNCFRIKSLKGSALSEKHNSGYAPVQVTFYFK